MLGAYIKLNLNGSVFKDLILNTTVSKHDL